MSENNPMFEKPAGQGQPGQPQHGAPQGQSQYGIPQGQPQYGAPPPPPYAPPPASPPVGQPAHYGAAPGALTPSDEKLWGGMAHWGALVLGFLTGLAFLAPLLVMVIQGNKSAYVRAQAVESLNFQLTMLIAGIVSAVLMLLLIGFLLLPIVGLLWLIFTIIGSIKAVNGQFYRYPMTIRMVS